MKQNFGSLIKKMRTEKNLTQQELANLVGYTSGMGISLLENNKRKVSIEMLNKIANICDCNLEIEIKKFDK